MAIAAERADYSLPYAIDARGNELTGRHVDAELWEKVRAAPEQNDMSHARCELGLVRRVALPGREVATLFLPASAMARAMARFPEETPPPLWIPVGATVMISTLFGGLLAWYVSQPIRTLRWA